MLDSPDERFLFILFGVLFVIEIHWTAQGGLELTAFPLPLFPSCWNVPPHLVSNKKFLKQRAKAPSVRTGGVECDGMK